MSLTISIVRRTVIGNMRLVVAKVSFDSSYPTGGESLTPSDLALNNVEVLIPTPKNGYVFEYDYSNNKLKAFYADYDASSDGALIEVSNGANLSSLTNVYVTAIGR